MDRYPKRLIEVDLPIKRISAHSRREKSIRHGHICTLHIWWARRPLAACRAVICASLWPDPADDLCPDSFRKTARNLMLKWAKEHLGLLSQESYSRFITFQKEPKKLNDPVEIRKALLDFIADFANWDNSTAKEYLETARSLTQAAHEALGGASGTRPLVVDPFAGGGSIPLEALRVGADAFASDLNPVAVLLNKVVLEYIPKYGQRLADEVRKWGEWVKEKAEKELTEFYPKDPDGATPIAYLWARTIQCEGPNCGAEVPLIRSLWLAKKTSRSVALQLVPRLRAKRVDFRIIVKQRGGWVDQDNPKEKIAEPKFDGTVKRGSATCPCCGYTTPVARVREQLKVRRGGAQDARLFCVVTIHPDKRGRCYRTPRQYDIKAVTAARQELERRKNTHIGALSLFPDELIPLMSGVFNVPIYGHDTWSSLFTPRQLLAMVTVQSLIKQTNVAVGDSGLSTAVKTCLAIVLDKLADKATSLCGWKSTAEYMGGHTFGRQALPMFWDFCEANVFGDVSGDIGSETEWVVEFLSHADLSRLGAGNTSRHSATDQPIPDDAAELLFTDPPYYNAVPYADLSDFFYVWLRRTIGDSYPDLFSSDVSPKEDECCEMAGWDPVRYPHKNAKWFETKMGQAMSTSLRVLAPKGIGIVVFAHKTTIGWEALLQAMVDSGWVITGSWPLDTEMGSRLRAMNSAALASSVHLVCRPRENPDGSVTTDEVGDWRDVLGELPRRIHEWMPRMAEEGVVGADAIFACLGPALEIFSRYSRVEKASGEKVELREYLEHVWAAVAREALTMIFEGADASGFEEDARLTAMWLWTLRTDETGADSERAEENGGGVDEEDGGKSRQKTKGGFALEFDAARKIAQGLGAHLEELKHLVDVQGEIAVLLPVAARTRYLFGKESAEAPRGRPKKKEKQLTLNFEGELKQIEEESADWTGELKGKAGRTVLDQLHQSMILFAAGRSEALKRFLVEDGIGRNPLFWRLAQALSALYPTGTDEKRWVDGVLARKKGLGF